MRRRRQEDVDEQPSARGPRPFWWRFLVHSPRDALVGIVAAGAMTTIVVNSLFLQPGPHPAPIFSIKSPIAANEATGAVVLLPRPRPVAAEATPAAVTATTSTSASPPGRMRGEIVADLQRELARRGFYDGAVDGLYGAKTDAALRDFEQAAGIKTPGDANEATLQVVQRSTVKSRIAANAPAPVRRDPIGELLRPAAAPASPAVSATASASSAAAPVPTPSRQLLAVQRALGEYGYGQIRATGLYDPDTRSAIERFERERSLPVTGQMSDRLLRELAAMTGRPLD
jgi:peptidoglycan hydrolase-like protein with peptidoglycan-binding domain